MIIDAIEYLPLYGILKEDKLRLIQELCRRSKLEDLPEGRIDLAGDDLFALVQSYPTRSAEGGLYEAHQKYLDLQYMVSGEEYFYMQRTSRCELVEDKRPAKDCMFLKAEEDSVRAKVGPEMFALLFPQDAHMPCIQVQDSEFVKKIVFKIRIA